MAAAAMTGIPAKVYWTTASRASIAELAKAMSEHGMSWEEDGPQDDGPEIGLLDEQITTWVDIRDYSDQKYDALLAHESRAGDIFFLKLGRQRFRDLMGRRPSCVCTTRPRPRYPSATSSTASPDGSPRA